MYLVDTNILSELARPEPDPGVLAWASEISHVAVSVITAEELYFGLAWKPRPKVRAWVEAFLDQHCDLLPITLEIARSAGELRGRLRAQGVNRSQADILIAATAQAHDLILVTRNARDFEHCPVRLLDPFG
ncbi:MAG TPA: type II toxin-antitoxin system VapC family toxin [Thermoanaerobaculia bacterium]